jgi:septum formation protein
MAISLSAPFILASASPRRQELLRLIGMNFRIIPAHVRENYRKGEGPREHVRRLAAAKAAAVAAKYPAAWVLGADTIVVIDGQILGKPKNKSAAQKMLIQLSGREHKVFTGFTLICGKAKVSRTKTVQSAVRFQKISPSEREWYVSSSEPYDKAGGYAVQGKGACFIKSIRGSYTNVIGLPLSEFMEELKKLGAINFR